MTVGEQDLASGKNPPLCDGCATAFTLSEETETYNVRALVLGGTLIWGLVCDRCKEYHMRLPMLTEKDTPLEARRALHDVLGRNMEVVVLE